jgi:hypothetical protein
MHGVLVGYGRTSTTEQHAGLEAQRRGLTAAGCRKVFEEEVSSIKERPQLQAAPDYTREGDTLVVTKLDRLARSARHLSRLVDALERKASRCGYSTSVATRSIRAAPSAGSRSTCSRASWEDASIGWQPFPVEAPHAEAAIERAIAEFNLDEAHRSRLIAQLVE